MKDSTISEDFSELIELTKLYLIQEFPEKGEWLKSCPEVMDYFRNYFYPQGKKTAQNNSKNVVVERSYAQPIKTTPPPPTTPQPEEKKAEIQVEKPAITPLKGES